MFVVGTALVNVSTSAVFLERRHPIISHCPISLHSWDSSRQHQAGAGSLKLVDGERRFFPLRVSYPQHSRKEQPEMTKPPLPRRRRHRRRFKRPRKYRFLPPAKQQPFRAHHDAWYRYFPTTPRIAAKLSYPARFQTHSGRASIKTSPPLTRTKPPLKSC